MPSQLQRRRGTTAEHAAFTGAEGEITVDTDKNTAVVHDGATPGGFPLVKESDVAANLADYTALRAYAGGQKSTYVTGYLVSAAPSGIAGLFTRDDSDTTSADNGGTIIVAANGKRWRRVFDGAHRVKWFGAKGDGVTLDHASVVATIAAASNILTFPGQTTRPMASVHFDDGVFLIDDGALNLTAYRNGVRFTGNGWYTSVLRFKAGLAAPSYMFNNGAAERLSFAVFENLGFEGTTPANYTVGTIPANANFIRQWSAAQTQGFKFISCRFSGFDSMMLCEGTNTASENKWVNCKISHIQNYVLGLNNSQSLNHEFVATDIENIIGDVFKTFANGGGAIHVFGGSIIPQGGAILKLTGPLVSQGVTLSGVRVELRGTSMIMDGSAGNHFGAATFRDSCLYMTEPSGSKEVAVLRAPQKLLFEGCDHPSNGQRATYRLAETSSFGQNGHIHWEACQVPSTLSADISFASSYGHASANRCVGLNYGAIAAEPFIYAHDFNLGAGGVPYGLSGGTNAAAPAKRVWLKQTNTIWPKSNGAGASANDLTVKLPAGAIIKAIVIRKSAGGSAVAAYQLQVTNNDKTVVHATSNLADQLNAHSATLNDYFYSVGATDNERIIRVSVNASTANGAAQNLTGGFGYIEYL